MTKLRIDLDREGVRYAALSSPDVRAAIREIAERTASTARSAGTGDEIVVIDGGIKRARAYVRRLDGGAAAEAKDRILGRSLPGGG